MDRRKSDGQNGTAFKMRSSMAACEYTDSTLDRGRADSDGLFLVGVPWELRKPMSGRREI